MGWIEQVFGIDPDMGSGSLEMLIVGAVIAGLVLGLFQQAANFLVGGIFASVAVFTVFILVLLMRPEGLAGTAVGRRV